MNPGHFQLAIGNFQLEWPSASRKLDACSTLVRDPLMSSKSIHRAWREPRDPSRPPLVVRSTLLLTLLSVATSALTGLSAPTPPRDPSPALTLDFGMGNVKRKHDPATPDTIYPGDRGWGFDLGSNVRAVDRSRGNALRRDFITADTPFFFSAQLPEGNYRVTVILGDREGSTTNTIKAESRRLMLENVVTRPGKFVTRTFTVNIRTPAIPGGKPVGLKKREIGVLHWDDKLTLEFNGSRPAVCGLTIAPAKDVVTVYLLGDSTVTDQPDEPWNSWGQMLTRFFTAEVAVANYAESGESLRSSLGARRVKKVFSSLQAGDYVLVQFGHNDMKDKATNALAVYKANLKELVRETRAKGATPVLITSMERKAGIRGETLAGYPQTVRDVAREDKVALIDLQSMSLDLYRALGPNLNAAFQDGTHHNAYGSYELAKCVVHGIQQNELPLARFVAQDVAPFDPRNPDPLDAFDLPASPNRSELKPDGN